MTSAERTALALDGRRTGRGWIARCPAHDDRSPSLAIAEGRDGCVVVRCHAGCGQWEVIAALRERGLWRDVAARHDSDSDRADLRTRARCRDTKNRAYRARWRAELAEVRAAQRAGDAVAEVAALARLDAIDREWRAWRDEHGDPSARVTRAVADIWGRWRTEDAVARVRRGARDAAA